MTSAVLTALGLCSCQNEVQLDGPLNGTAGGSVVFKLTNPPSLLTRIEWLSPKPETIIFFFEGAILKVSPAYVDRISLNTTTASLELRNLSSSDSGEYTVTIESPISQGKTSLTVLGMYFLYIQ